MDAGFIIRRLGRMSFPEVLDRILDWKRTAWDGWTYQHRVLHEYPVKPGDLAVPDMDDETRNALQSKADAFCMHRFDIFALKDIQLGFPIRHEQDMKSGKSAPKGVFSGKMDYRDHVKIGDIKYIWETSRHLHFPLLALAWRVFGDRKYLIRLETDWLEWIDSNPFLTGIHWTSPLEIGIRLINWTIAWQWAGEDLSENARHELLHSAALQISHITRHYSGYSSANNHLVGEAAGVLIAGLGLVACSKTEQWKRKALHVLLRELRLQNHEDGVNKEQALSYQQFVLDFFLLSFGFCIRSGVPVPESAYVTLRKMILFLALCQVVDGETMAYGDEDDGLVINLLQNRPGIYHSLINTGNSLLGIFADRRPEMNPNLKQAAIALLLNHPGTDLKSAFYHILYQKAGIPFETANNASSHSFDTHTLGDGLFPDGGYAFLGKDFGEKKEQKLMFDHGELGYLSISAHGHADALSFVFAAGGKYIFIDSGTYSYHANRKWRNWFRGTSAHNTIEVDGLNQSTIEGDFMWGRKAKCTLTEHVPLRKVSASHDGYLSLPDGVLHERSIEYLADQDRWVIRDSLQCAGKHRISIYFHLHPEARATEGKDGVWNIKRGRVGVALKQDGKTVAVLSEGDADTPAGWFSPSYDVKVPAQSLCFSSEITGMQTFEHTFSATILEDDG